MKKINNLFVKGKKLALIALLATSLNVYGSGATVEQDIQIKQQEQKTATTKDLNKQAFKDLSVLVLLIGVVCLGVPAAVKDDERKRKIMEEYRKKHQK